MAQVTRVVCQGCADAHTYRDTCGFRLPELVSAVEAAAILGVSRQRVHQLRARPLFPVPVIVLASGAIWLRSDIDEFNRVWTRKPGRPASSP